jgi:hypothetical protein
MSSLKNMTVGNLAAAGFSKTISPQGDTTVSNAKGTGPSKPDIEANTGGQFGSDTADSNKNGTNAESPGDTSNRGTNSTTSRGLNTTSPPISVGSDSDSKGAASNETKSIVTNPNSKVVNEELASNTTQSCGADSNGLRFCQGNTIIVCNFGRPVSMACAPGTTCTGAGLCM